MSIGCSVNGPNTRNLQQSSSIWVLASAFPHQRAGASICLGIQLHSANDEGQQPQQLQLHKLEDFMPGDMDSTDSPCCNQKQRARRSMHPSRISGPQVSTIIGNLFHCSWGDYYRPRPHALTSSGAQAQPANPCHAQNCQNPMTLICCPRCREGKKGSSRMDASARDKTWRRIRHVSSKDVHPLGLGRHRTRSCQAQGRAAQRDGLPL